MDRKKQVMRCTTQNKYIMSYCTVCIILAQVVLASIDVLQKIFCLRNKHKSINFRSISIQLIIGVMAF